MNNEFYSECSWEKWLIDVLYFYNPKTVPEIELMFEETISPKVIILFDVEPENFLFPCMNLQHSQRT